MVVALESLDGKLSKMLLPDKSSNSLLVRLCTTHHLRLKVAWEAYSFQWEVQPLRAGQRGDFITAQPGVLASTEEMVECAAAVCSVHRFVILPSRCYHIENGSE